jgi:hypothetical protein
MANEPSNTLDSSRDSGSAGMTIDATSNRWPADVHAGAGTATNTDSILEHCTRTLLDGVLILASHSAGTTVTIYEHDGTTVVETLSIAANQAAPLFIPLGGPNGREVPSGLCAKVSNTGTIPRMFFRRADGNPYE